MISKECKRLAEVDFPIAVVSKHSAREKSIRHGHPSTLHLWWARRPLAACRAMLLGLLLPDPGDEHCPEDFKQKARDLLSRLLGNVGPKDEDLRKSLLRFIGDFANWDNSNQPTFLDVGRGLVKAAHGEETPLVVDPFAGGGSIPLEALRLGCEAFASDLNPVACLILKVMLEDIPRHGPELAKELRRVGGEIKKQAEQELAEFYPKDPDGATPIAYLWARTVRCESPNCGAEIPLVRSFWILKKASRRRALRWKVGRDSKGAPSVQFEVFEPKSESDVPNGTVTRAKATCLCCGTVLSPQRVRAQLRESRGGTEVVFNERGQRTIGATLLAVITLRTGSERGRDCRLPNDRDYQAVFRACSKYQELSRSALSNGLSRFPDEKVPLMSGTFNVPIYGMEKWEDLFTARQKVTTDILRQAIDRVDSEMKAVKTIASIALSRRTDISNSLCPWSSSANQVVHLFGRQAIPMLWDFAESSPFGGQAGDYEVTLRTIARVVQALGVVEQIGQVQQADAVQSPLPDQTASAWFTDPPYYFAVPYADLSDFFFVWLKRVFYGNQFLRDPFDPTNPLTPKEREICEMKHWDPVRYASKDKTFFEEEMAKAFAEGHRVLKDDGIGSVVFAHKTTEGWEALLAGLIKGRWTITASWPIATEKPGRLRSLDSAALATSVHLVCRPRPENASIGDWGVVLRELPKRVGDWMEHLQSEGIRGADLVFACIGPALEIFSRYSQVETAEGREVKLAEYLEKVWEVVGRMALEQVLGTAEAQARNSAAGALEEDARLTALFLWTLQATNGENGVGGKPGKESEDDSGDEDEEDASPKGKAKGFSLVFDVVRRFAQPLGIQLPKWEGRVIETTKGVVRLLAVSERAKQLFGENGADTVAEWIMHDPRKDIQPLLFPELAEKRAPKIRGHKRGRIMPGLPVEAASQAGATTLDRVHAAMLLQAGGQAHALRELIKAEQDRGPDFLRLANALSALYPKSSEEKRLLDAMLLAVPR